MRLASSISSYKRRRYSYERLFFLCITIINMDADMTYRLVTKLDTLLYLDNIDIPMTTSTITQLINREFDVNNIIKMIIIACNNNKHNIPVYAIFLNHPVIQRQDYWKYVDEYCDRKTIVKLAEAGLFDDLPWLENINDMNGRYYITSDVYNALNASNSIISRPKNLEVLDVENTVEKYIDNDDVEGLKQAQEPFMCYAPFHFKFERNCLGKTCISYNFKDVRNSWTINLFRIEPIDYAAYVGAAKCFKYLANYYNENREAYTNITQMTYCCALVGGNTDIICECRKNEFMEIPNKCVKHLALRRNTELLAHALEYGWMSNQNIYAMFNKLVCLYQYKTLFKLRPVLHNVLTKKQFERIPVSASLCICTVDAYNVNIKLKFDFLFKRYGFDINAWTGIREDTTALIQAVKYNDVSTIVMFITEYKADPELATMDGLRAIDFVPLIDPHRMLKKILLSGV